MIIKKERLGKINKNLFGTEMQIIDYKSHKDIRVKFLDKNGYEVDCRYDQFSESRLVNPYDKTIAGVGYLGVGEHVATIQSRPSKKYRVWNDMINRCYNEKDLNKRPTYRDVIVCEEWHNFQVFGDWYDDNYYEVDDFQMNIEKDILIKGNKVYSPDTCVFTPHFINKLFLKSDAMRGEYPIGVHYNKWKDSIEASCNNNFTGKTIYLGDFSTPELAFQAYKEYKENHIKEVAEYYKDKIPKKLYDAMYRYEVDIDD